jgi:hypothetical protein
VRGKSFAETMEVKEDDGERLREEARYVVTVKVTATRSRRCM